MGCKSECWRNSEKRADEAWFAALEWGTRFCLSRDKIQKIGFKLNSMLPTRVQVAQSAFADS
eukprot:CAMPEP_0184312598 /NCGR_PEP_ID=MMETSP1049-20130417/50702_1 /TAXON_ID=77928 /ORGANISM="Proteomonas sulcata, Strain CCMP704" /LENGTH=61 /DNA_ID=CAMNT_0026628859 /DNA_START=373 /DNA_END=558 /DNA_ORIENTATION=-